MISLFTQFTRDGKLSKKQAWALKDMLEIDEEFYNWDYVCDNPNLSGDYSDLLAKFKRDRFRSVKTKNKCVRAMESIIQNAPDTYLINDALGRISFRGYRR